MLVYLFHLSFSAHHAVDSRGHTHAHTHAPHHTQVNKCSPVKENCFRHWKDDIAILRNGKLWPVYYNPNFDKGNVLFIKDIKKSTCDYSITYVK